MGKKSKQKKNNSNSGRKRKQTGTPSPGQPRKMASVNKSDATPTPPYIPNMQNEIIAPQQNASPLANGVLSAANQTLYGYPFTPYQQQHNIPSVVPYNTPALGHNNTPAHMYTQMSAFPPASSSPPPPPIDSVRLEQFMTEVTHRLKKLDILDDILARLEQMEKHCKKLDGEMEEVRTTIKTHSSNLISVDQGLSEVFHRVQEMERQNHFLMTENNTMKERMIEQQSRSMRDNLIFKGIDDENSPSENTEEKVKDFIKTHLELDDEINFHVLHRLRPRKDKGPRGIIARFEKRKDRNKVLDAAKEKLKQKPEFVVHEQYTL